MAANWKVVRIVAPIPGTVSLGCLETEHAVAVTLKDLTTGIEDTIQLCTANDTVDPCRILRSLASAGYVPNDWTDECPS